MCGECRPWALGLSKRGLVTMALSLPGVTLNLGGPYLRHLHHAPHIMLLEIALILASFAVWLACALYLMQRLAVYHRLLFVAQLDQRAPPSTAAVGH